MASHYTSGPDGNVHAIDRVEVAARVARTGDVPGNLPRADGPGVEFRDLPDYLGSWQYARCPGWLGRLREVLADYNAFCLRVACPIGALARRELRRQGWQFGRKVGFK